jgi:hypothetical protein
MYHLALSLRINAVVFCCVALGYPSRSAEVSVRMVHDAKPCTQMRPTSQCLWHAFCNEHDIAR